MEKNKINDIDSYIAAFPPKTREILQQVRDTIRKAAPMAEETISYQIPTFTLNGGNLVHFAGYKDHIGFYPTPSGIEKFKDELSGYKGAKGSVQFPIDQEIPYDLLERIVKFRVEEIVQKSAANTKKVKAKKAN